MGGYRTLGEFLFMQSTQTRPEADVRAKRPAAVHFPDFEAFRKLQRRSLVRAVEFISDVLIDGWRNCLRRGIASEAAVNCDGFSTHPVLEGPTTQSSAASRERGKSRARLIVFRS